METLAFTLPAPWLRRLSQALAMNDYRTMTPCERVTYYGREIRRLTPPGSQRERLLIEVFRVLVAENEPLCTPDDTDGRQAVSADDMTSSNRGS